MTEETKRDRVRRLLISPLQARGMRFRKGTDADVAKRTLDDLADELAYLEDAKLKALEEILRTKGDGVDKCFWPPRIAILSWAEALQKRPIEELPALASWLGSVEGPRAVEDGTLVATFLFVQRNKRPPINEHDRNGIRARARDMGQDVALWRDRKRRGVASAHELDRLAKFEALEARAMTLVEVGFAKRSVKGAVA